MTLARYGKSFRKRALARLLPPESAKVEDVARQVGIQPYTLERWRLDDAKSEEEPVSSWTATARLDAVLVTATMDEASKSAWCRTNGVHLQELATWRANAISALGDAKPAPGIASVRPSAQSKDDRRRIQELERELKRKNAALAETAALLVLSKELAAIFRKGEDE